MSKFKKAAVVLVIAAMILSQVGIVLAQPQDVQGHWAQQQIMEWLDEGLIQCPQDGLFRPDAEITRGEFIALVNRAFGFYDSTQVNFSDLPQDDQYAEEVARAVAAGYISGFGDGTVRPYKLISRLETTVILAKIAELPQSEDYTILDGFTDGEDIAAWGRGFVAAAVDTGLVSGYPDGSFRPQENMTRAEAIVVLNNVLDTLDFTAENITIPGYLEIHPVAADSGTLREIVLYYSLGEEFTDGTVVFHLPPGITAAEHQDKVVITSRDGETETFELEPIHIGYDGRDVYVSGITSAEDGVVILLLHEKKIPQPGFHTFSVTADADGAAGSKSPTEEEYSETVDIFSAIPPEGQGILEVSPQSAETGSIETFMLDYTIGDNFNEGWIEFELPQEIAAVAGKDKIKIDGVEELLSEINLSDDGRRVHVTGITAEKGQTVTLQIFEKTIPEPGPHFFRVRADADGEVATKPATLGTGREFVAFLAYSETDNEDDIIKSFVKAINERDAQAATELLADNVVYVDNYMDGFLDVVRSREDVEIIIDYMVEFGFNMINDEDTMQAYTENAWKVEGKANDYFTELTARLYPDDGFDGMGYTGKYFVTDNKICYIEFFWDREDEVLYEKLREGYIGVYLSVNDNDDMVVAACAPGLPAEKAGLKPGDIIVAVNGINIEDMGDYRFQEAMHRVGGKAGTKVTITINRNGEVFDVEIERTGY